LKEKRGRDGEGVGEIGVGEVGGEREGGEERERGEEERRGGSSNFFRDGEDGGDKSGIGFTLFESCRAEKALTICWQFVFLHTNK
jgi:hypothetical protein